MFVSDGVFVGIDPTAGERPIHYVAIDGDLKLMNMSEADLEGVLAFMSSLKEAIVAVNSPQTLCKGLLGRSEIRAAYNLRPGGRTWSKWRVCEFELRRRNIRTYRTPQTLEKARGWIRVGLELHARLDRIGFRVGKVGAGSSDRARIEVNPHASFTAMLGHRPFLKRTLEGRMQRQLVLYLAGLQIPNPLIALEEITRHRLLTGDMPLEDVYHHEFLDAMVAAYTAYLVQLKPEQVTRVGHPEEGWITLPVDQLKDSYH